jgi:hypothetical protein
MDALPYRRTTSLMQQQKMERSAIIERTLDV